MNRQTKRRLTREAAKTVSRMKKDLDFVNGVRALNGQTPITPQMIGQKRRPHILRIVDFIKGFGLDKLRPEKTT